MKGGGSHGQAATRGTNDSYHATNHRVRHTHHHSERGSQPRYRLGGGDMVSDRYLEHPDITAALRTGYPRRWWEDEPEENEYEEEDDEAL